MRHHRPAAIAVVLACIMTLLLPYAVIEQALDSDRQQRIQQINLALLKSAEELTQQLDKLTQDHTFASQLDWSLQHSLQRTLQAQLNPGYVDQLHILNEDCRSLLRVRLGVDWISPVCPHGDAALLQGTQTFLGHDQGIVHLMVVRQLQRRHDDMQMFVAAIVTLDQQWFAKLGWHHSNFTLSPIIQDSKSPLALEQIIAPYDVKYTVSTGQLASLMRSLSAAQIALMLVNGLFAAVIVAMIFIYLRSQRQQEQRLMQALFRVANSGNPSGGSSAKRPAPGLRGAVKQVEQAIIQAKSDRDRLAQHCEKLARQIKDLEQNQASLTQERDRLSQHQQVLQRSVSNGVRAISALEEISEGLDELTSISDDIESITTHGLLAKFDALSGLFHQWQVGIKSRGTRRFLRSLEETKSNNTTLLEAQIHFFIETLTQCRDLLLNIGIHHRKLFHRLTRVQQMHASNVNEPGQHKALLLSRLVQEANDQLEDSGITLSIASEGWKEIRDRELSPMDIITLTVAATRYLAQWLRGSSTCFISGQASLRGQAHNLQLVISLPSPNEAEQRQGAQANTRHDPLTELTAYIEKHNPDWTTRINPLRHVDRDLYGLILSFSRDTLISEDEQTGIGAAKTREWVSASPSPSSVARAFAGPAAGQ